ncbi:MAG: GNAT family N-acetyltransferase [Solirubrobacterales bacterium]|nr:GNAT family N-acetyltransferase [Solirubrobacterales bacterium]MBV9714259.1 GNAT family N-acetyltransferase [Solirubrobacterales bacterium]
MLEVISERLVLRPFRVEDLQTFVAYRRDPAVARYQGWETTYSMADAARFLAAQPTNPFRQRGEWLQLAVVDRDTRGLLGDCAPQVIADQPATAEIGVTLATSSQGKGVAREAVAGLVSVLVQQHGMHRVVAQADERNCPVHRLLKRLGFRCEGRLVEADWFKGEWHTLRIYAVLESEWR